MGRAFDPTDKYFRWPHHVLPVLAVGERTTPGHRTDDDIARDLGCNIRTVLRLRAEGLDYWWADRVATRVLRTHPEQVWPNWRLRTTLAIVMDEAIA